MSSPDSVPSTVMVVLPGPSAVIIRIIAATSQMFELQAERQTDERVPYHEIDFADCAATMGSSDQPMRTAGEAGHSRSVGDTEEALPPAFPTFGL